MCFSDMNPLSETCPMDATNALNPMCSYFAAVDDPRRQHSTTLHSLEAILIITILGTICGAHNWVEIEQWGQAQESWLSEFLELPHGIPSHDTFGRVFALLDPESLHQAFVAWMSALAQLCQEIIALDGKTIRRSLDRADGKGPIHVVSAWASRNELVLAQFKVDAKSNEITALPALLALLNLEGSLVTIDAMGCQVEIAQQIITQGGDYVLSLKENQPSLYTGCVELFAWLKGPHALDEEIVLGADEQVDGGHGRVETRQVWCTSALEGVVSCERWPGLTSLVMVESTRHIDAQDEVEQRYYISSLPGATDADAKRLNEIIRTHWEIENRVHWVLDVAMAEDTNRTRKGESAQNLALVRKLALNLLRRETSVKTGVAAKQKRAGWDHNYLLKILAQT
jgi:predicted transposase YbfD/YdcC